MGGPGGWGAGPDASSRRGFLPPPSHGLGPWPVPGNRHGALLPAGPGLSHTLPGDSCRLAQRLGAGPLLPQAGAQGLAWGSPALRWARAEGACAGPDDLVLPGAPAPAQSLGCRCLSPGGCRPAVTSCTPIPGATETLAGSAAPVSSLALPVFSDSSPAHVRSPPHTSASGHQCVWCGSGWCLCSIPARWLPASAGLFPF